MKMLLIHPFLTTSNLNCPSQTEPLGLAYLAAYIRNEYEVEILDLYAMGISRTTRIGNSYRFGVCDGDEIARLVADKCPDVIGITCNFTEYANDSLEVARIIKARFPGVLIVLGGAHASMDDENILRNNPAIDVVVRGEGEITLKALLDVLKRNENIKQIDGISFRGGANAIVRNPPRPFISDLDSLPFPARDLLDMNVYKKINEVTFPFAKKLPILTMMSSRGCPFNCIFCSTKVVWGRTWRPRSPESVVAEIEHLVKTYGIKEVAMYDDQFIGKKARVGEICDLLIKNKIKLSISVPSGVSGWLLDEELLVKMKKAGFYRFSLSIETGNAATSKFIKKPVDFNKLKIAIEAGNRLGFWLQSNFIIGFPYETKKEIQETINYADTCGVDYAIFLIAQPYAGAEMHALYAREGLLKRTETQATNSSITSGNYDTMTLTAGEIQNIRDRAQAQFLKKKLLSYARPSNFYKYLFPKLFHMRGGVRYAGKLLRTVLKS